MQPIAPLALTLLVASLGPAVAQASNVVDLEESNWNNWVGNGKSALIEFWAPWCEHCQQLDPVYEELGDIFAHVKDTLVIGKVNSDAQPAKRLLEAHGIVGLPTIKWFEANGVSEEYDPKASRTLESLADYVTKKSGLKAKLQKSTLPTTYVTRELTQSNFDEIVNDPAKDVLVAFTATWCGHCKEMKPIYDLVASWFKSEQHVVIANLDSDADVDQALAKKYDVPGYPILKLFPKGSRDKTPIDYILPRDEKSLVEFLNEHTGTQRAVGGGVNEKAGRVEALDEVAKDFVGANPSQRKELYKRAKTIATEAGNFGKQYLRIMNKLLNGTDDYLTEEKTHLLGILKKHGLTEDKLDEIKIKYNILSTFVMNPAADKIADGIRVERAPEESASKASGSVSSVVTEAVETEVKRVKEEL